MKKQPFFTNCEKGILSILVIIGACLWKAKEAIEKATKKED